MVRAVRRRGAAQEPVYEITGVRRSLTEDVGARQRRYAISMAIRTACFLLMVVTDGWLQWAFLAGALVLPYLSVVIANAGPERHPELPATLVEQRRRALGGGTGEG